ncbi:hypothetical protein HMPREF2532_02911 [Bacteroides ovatus]|nr:hypothetical protein HMPREF2534_03910 [Bacteroides thetaiotaomicron]KXT46467.1 hypothetical protein HMPREF2532_02911 [Bacteroides ovatus]
MNRNERDFSNTFCSRFLAATDNCGVTFTAFFSALRTKSSAVAPSKTGIFLIVITIIINFMQILLYYHTTKWYAEFNNNRVISIHKQFATFLCGYSNHITFLLLSCRRSLAG